MFVKIAIVLIILWLIGITVLQDLVASIYALPLFAIIMIMFSGYRRRLNNPYDN